MQFQLISVDPAGDTSDALLSLDETAGRGWPLASANAKHWEKVFFENAESAPALRT